MNLIASSNSKPSRAVLPSKPATAVARVPAAKREDRFMRGGRALFAAFRAPTPLERLLACVRVALGLLADALRSSSDPQDAPVVTLGHHYVSCRDVAPEGVMMSGSRFHGCQLRLQEICTFDPDEGPKRYAMPEQREQAQPMARLHWQLVPVAHPKAKRLGRDLSVKIELAGNCTITLCGPAAAQHPAQGPGAGARAAAAAAAAETYAVQLPSLVLLDPLSAEGSPVAYKGDLIVSCPQMGLTASLRLAKDHSVQGVLEQLPPQPSGTSGGGAAASGAPQQAAAGQQQASRQLGVFGGSWRNQVYVSCPSMGTQGIVFECSERSHAPVPPTPVLDAVNLRRMGPVGSPRLWTALHDAVLYSDPRAASGGKAAVKLADALAAHLTGLNLGSADTRDAPAGAGGDAGSGGSGKGAGQAVDPDIDAFDRAVEGQGGASSDQGDQRAVPPCYKAQHAQGRRLWYTLHYSLLDAEPADPSAPNTRPGSAAGRPGSGAGRPGSAAGRPGSARPGSGGRSQ